MSQPKSWAAFRLASMSGAIRLKATWADCRIEDRGLLISWAMPAASMPTEVIFSVWTRISCMRTWAVTSSMRATASPRLPAMGKAVTSYQAGSCGPWTVIRRTTLASPSRATAARVSATSGSQGKTFARSSPFTASGSVPARRVNRSLARITRRSASTQTSIEGMASTMERRNSPACWSSSTRARSSG